MTTWFGQSWGAPMNRECPQVPVPVGAACFYCEEIFGVNDSGVKDVNGVPMHYNCFMRGLIGSIAHQQKRCICFGHAEESDSALTRRQEADAAVAYWEKRQKRLN